MNYLKDMCGGIVYFSYIKLSHEKAKHVKS